MNRVIWLDIKEPKCIGSACRHQGGCARLDVAPDKGRPLDDFSRSPGMYMSAPCSAPGWLRRIDPATAVKPAPGPSHRVHETPQGIGRG